MKHCLKGSCKYTKSVIREILFDSFEKVFILKKILTISFLLSLGMTGMFNHNQGISILCSAMVGCGLLMIILYLSALLKSINNIYIHNNIGIGNHILEKEVLFFEDKFVVVNKNISSKVVKHYSDIISINKTKRLLLLMLNDKTTCVIEKNSSDYEKIQSLVEKLVKV